MAIDKIVIQYEAQVAEFKRELEGLKKELRSVDSTATKGAKKTEQAFDKAGGGVNKLGANLKNLAGTMGLVLGAQEVIAFTKRTIDAASDLNETVSKTQQIFGTASAAVEAFAANSAKDFGMSKRAALDAASSFGGLGKAAGLSGEDLSTFSTDLVALSADLASFGNTTPEEAALALGAALRGESEPIRKYNVILDDAALKQEALRLKLISTTKDALSPQNKILAANSLIMKQTADAQGDFGKTAEGAANQQRILAANFENVMAMLGEKLLPAFQEGAQTLNEFMAAVDWDMVFGGIGDAYNEFIGPWKEIFSSLKEVFDLLTANSTTGEQTASVMEAIGVAAKIGSTPIRLLAKYIKALTDNILVPLITTGQKVIAWFNEVREGGGFVGAVFNGIASAAQGVIDKLRGVAEFIGFIDSEEDKAAKNKIKAEEAKKKAVEDAAKAEQAAKKEKAAADVKAAEEEKKRTEEQTKAAAEAAKKRQEINKAFAETARKLSEEITLALIEDENKRALKQLELQKAADLLELEATEFTAEQKGKLRAQIDAKYQQLEKDRIQKQLEDEVKIREAFLKEEEQAKLEEENLAKEAEQRKFEEYLKYWELKQQNEIDSIEDLRQRKLEELRIAEENEIAKVEASEYAAEIIAEIQKKYGLKRIEIEKQTQKETNIAIADGLGQLASGFGSMLSSFAAISGESAEYVKALSVVQVGIQTAVALANAIAGATAAANATGPGAPFALAGYIASMIGTVVGAFAQVNQLLTAEVPKPGFFEGTPYLQLGGNQSGKDTIPVMAHEGEAIIPTSENLQYPGLAKSWINGNLDSYIHNQFVRPALIDQQQKAEEDFADRLAASMALQMSSQFDDYRLHRDLKEQTAVLRNGFYHMKETRKKVRGGR